MIQHIHIDIAYVINCGLSVGFITVNASSLASLPTIKNSRMKATGTIIGNSCNATVSKVRKNPSDENGSEASDENGYSKENIATDTQEDAVDIQDKSIDRLLDAADEQ